MILFGQTVKFTGDIDALFEFPNQWKRHHMARQKLKPKPDPMLQVGYEVDNPFFSASAPEEQKTIKVTRTLRRDQLAWLHSQGHISDPQYHAGRDYQRYAEDAEVGRIGCVDPTAEPVDQGRRMPTVLTDRQMKAIKMMHFLHGALGARGKELADGVLVERMTYRECARRFYDGPTPATLKFVGRRFGEVLDTLSAEFGYG